jgi:hypothetical protein
MLDRDHALLIEHVIRLLEALGWVAAPEMTLRAGSERGSIDIFGRHPGTGGLLVVEVKSVVPDVHATLAGIDRKARLAPSIARDRGWPVGPVSRILVLPHDRTARRRLAQSAATFDRVFPARTIEIRRWLHAPSEPLAGVLFVSGATHTGTRHRIRTTGHPAERGRRGRL